MHQAPQYLPMRCSCLHRRPIHLLCFGILMIRAVLSKCWLPFPSTPHTASVAYASIDLEPMSAHSMSLDLNFPCIPIPGEGHAGRPGRQVRSAEDRRGRAARVAPAALGQPGPGGQAHHHVLAQLGQEPEQDELHLQPGTRTPCPPAPCVPSGPASMAQAMWEHSDPADAADCCAVL